MALFGLMYIFDKVHPHVCFIRCFMKANYHAHCQRCSRTELMLIKWYCVCVYSPGQQQADVLHVTPESKHRTVNKGSGGLTMHLNSGYYFKRVPSVIFTWTLFSYVVVFKRLCWVRSSIEWKWYDGSGEHLQRQFNHFFNNISFTQHCHCFMSLVGQWQLWNMSES